MPRKQQRLPTMRGTNTVRPSLDPVEARSGGSLQSSSCQVRWCASPMHTCTVMSSIVPSQLADAPVGRRLCGLRGILSFASCALPLAANLRLTFPEDRKRTADVGAGQAVSDRFDIGLRIAARRRNGRTLLGRNWECFSWLNRESENVGFRGRLYPARDMGPTCLPLARAEY